MSGSTFGLSPAATFWAIVSGLALLALVLFSGILLPFAAGFVLAYLFHPIVRGMGRARIPRGAAAFLIVAVLIVVLAAFLAVIVPPLAAQLGDLIENLPALVRARSKLSSQSITGTICSTSRGRRSLASRRRWSRSGSTSLRGWFPSFRACFKSGADLFNSLALLFLTPVITFFLLRDWDKMIASVWGFLPTKQAPAIAEIAREIDSTIAAYLRGTLIVLLIVSVFYMVSLGMIGLNYGLLIGLVAGLFSFVPYLGSTGGFPRLGRRCPLPVLARLYDARARLRGFRFRPGHGRQCADALHRRQQSATASRSGCFSP